MSAPLLYWHPGLWASIYLAMTVGYFGEGMGLERVRDYALMALWGFVVCAIMLVGTLSIDALLYAPTGFLAALAYGLNKPLGHRFGLDWTERAELCTGAIFGLALYLAAWLGV